MERNFRHVAKINFRTLSNFLFFSINISTIFA